MKILDPGPFGNSACVLQLGGAWGGGVVDRRGPFFGGVLEVLDVYHAGCS